MNQPLADLGRGHRQTIEKSLRPGEEVAGIWRGVRLPSGTTVLVATPVRVLVVKRATFSPQVTSYRFADIQSVHVTWGSFKNPFRTNWTEVELALAHGAGTPLEGLTGSSDKVRLARLEAPNTLYFGTGAQQEAAVREAVAFVEDKIDKARGVERTA